MSSGKVVVLHDDREDRERIRTALGESLIVEAAAGTGKTSELVHRIINVLETGAASVDQIVAVTFTHKAAGELKLRLRAGLDRRLGETSDIEQANIREALAHLEEASIGTIHSFCAQILRERPVEANIDPAFEELNEQQAARLRDRAFRWWFEKRLDEDSPALRRALLRIAGGRSTASEQLKYAARELIEWRDYPEDWLRLDWDRRGAIDHLAQTVLETAPRVSAKYADVKGLAQWITRYEAVRARDYDLLEARFVELRNRLRAQKGIDPLNLALEQFRRSAEADLACALRLEMLSLVDRYQDLKRRTGKLDFLDLLILARDLVRGNADVRRYLQRRFTRIFVDEFQDTDPLQAELLLLLASDDADESDWHNVTPSPGKLFVVGDPKQSIYKFRRADVALYSEIRQRLTARGVGFVRLTRNFRSSQPLEQFVNASFQAEMAGGASQAEYVPLRQGRPASETQPSIVALPVPRPYARFKHSYRAIDQSLPSAVCAWVAWLLQESGWKRLDRQSKMPVPIEPRDVCILFRRFSQYGQDVTREYTRGLEARGVDHVLVGSKSFHQREEVEMIRAALTAIEWPEDELALFATLKGSLFAISDGALLRYRSELGRLHPFGKRPADEDAELQPIAVALDAISSLHRRRNHRPVAATVNELLEQSRAHAALAIRPAGHQVLSNVYRIADMARSYEAGGGISFRGFVEDLMAQAERADSAESPILEEGASGVRLMTVHAAKGLEFPVVVLADLSARLHQDEPERYVRGKLCAMRLLRATPAELADNLQDELDRERAEGVRVAYVAATRARDLLVVPALGDAKPNDGRWLEPLEKALYPPRTSWRTPRRAPGCPAFGSSSVLERPPELAGYPDDSVHPGLHGDVVWWDPRALALDVAPQHGLRHQHVFADGPAAEKATWQYRDWQTRRDGSIAAGSRASIDLLLPSVISEAPPEPCDVELVTLERHARPAGRRFGTLVHAALRDLSVASVEMHARLLGATLDEVAAAETAVELALAHPILLRAQASRRALREWPITWRLGDGRTLDGVVDLAFEEDGRWLVVDFKTDTDVGVRADDYSRQLQWYAYALSKLTGQPASGVLLAV